MDEFKRGYLYARAMHSSTCYNMFHRMFILEAEISMARFLHHLESYPSRRKFCHFLALCWAASLCCGIYFWFHAGSSFLSLMRSSLYSSVSIVSLLLVTGLPFLLSAFAVFLSCHWLLPAIAFGKGFLFSFISMGALASFGCAGWLLRLLLCFSDLMSMPILYWFWLHCCRIRKYGFGCCTVLSAALIFLIGSIDYCLIAPFLADLIIL